MDSATLGIASVGAITILAYIVGTIVKATGLDNKWIPIICGVFGIAIGIVAYYLGMPEFPATDPITAAAVGGVSGLAATGVNEAVKQLTTK